MGACTLQIGSRLVLSSEDGPPPVEFALFDPGDVELTPPENGVVREAGYRTTAHEARRRLAVAGVTAELADEAAALVRGKVAEAYARGSVVRRLASRLGPAELFEGKRYDTMLRRYEGSFLDLALLANDAGLASGTGLFHALSLVARLVEVADDTLVVLSTIHHAATLRLGERSLRKHALDGVATLVRVLHHVATHPPAPPSVDASGPTEDEVVAALRSRMEDCARPEARERLARLAALAHPRERPGHGPLAEGELWELEQQLAHGDVRGVSEKLDAYEARRGREPGTIYLRAKASLVGRREPPRAIAERAASLSVSMSEFPELELLAAQAWFEAGEVRLAAPFARDLIANPKIDAELKAAAEAVLSGPMPGSVRGDAIWESQFESTQGDLTRSTNRPMPRAAASDDAPTSSQPPPWHPPASAPPPSPRRPPSSKKPLSVGPPAPQRMSPRATSAPPPPKSLTPPDAPAPSRAPRHLTPPEAPSAPRPPRASIPAQAQVLVEKKRDEAPSVDPNPTERDLRPSQWPAARPAPREERYRPEAVEVTPPASKRPSSQYFMRGASMPPHRSEPPPVVAIPRAPIVPRVDIDEVSPRVESLSLPAGFREEDARAISTPMTPFEARARFTLEARELARRYQRDHRTELVLDATAVAQMQRQLPIRFPDGTVRTPEEARDADLHGALLSEVLARVLGAEWIDVAPTERGYWAMVIPTRGGRERRVWPFGRVLRAIASSDGDLVHYFDRLRELT